VPHGSYNPPTTTSLTPGSSLGPYLIIELLAAGGMGEVYKARDARLDRTVAIKVLPAVLSDDPDVLQRFEREARAIAALSHPHICTLYDVGNQNGTEYLVMEYLEGETLAARLARSALPLAESLRYVVEILDALEHAHAHGILHCDLKPSNILLTKSGTKLLDFGIAKIQRRDPVLTTSDGEQSPAETASLAAEEALFGTAQYMAPERLEGEPASASADLFAVGAVLYEMITGRKAFDGRDRGEILAAILASEPVAVSELQPHVPPALDHVMARCLAKDPDRRWQSAHDLRLELQWFAERDSRTASLSFYSTRTAVGRVGAFVLGMAVIAFIVAFAARSFGPTSQDTQRIQFVVNPPADIAFQAGGGMMNISPDGRLLVFAAARAGADHLLWLRSLDSTSARPLAGTDGGLNPFWSPDSRFVGFFAQQKLKKTDVFGGPPETLCDAPGGLGGTWNRDGLILFARNNPGGLARVAAGGGPPTPVTHPETARQEYAHSWPQFLPDGHRFVYLIKSRSDAYTGIYLGSLEGNTYLRLVDADSNPVYTPGYLLFGRDGRVFAQPFDAGRARLRSEPVPLADQVVHNPITGRWSVAASETGVLAYRMSGPKQLLWVDRGGQSLGQVGPAGQYRNPALSPTGDRVAVARLDPRTGTEDIWVIETVRGTATRITFDPAWDTEPVWSPDGRQIVFASNRSGHYAIYQKAADGSGVETLLFSDGWPTDWSRDGRFLVFRNRPTTFLTLWALPLMSDRQPIPLPQTPFDVSQGHFSPDGRWLAYTSPESGSDVYVRPFPSREGRWQISPGGGIEPKWRGDSAELFYLAPDGKLMSVPIRTTRGFAAGRPRPLFDTALSARNIVPVIGSNQYDVTADGQRFLLNRPVSDPASSPITVVINWTSTLHP
jgi:Tol biopolymer transport system component